MSRTVALVVSMSEAEFRFVQSVGILVGVLIGVGSVWIGIRTTRSAGHVARVTALLAITTSHRDIWRQYASRPELSHALDWDAPPERMTEDEQQWLRELILHLAASFEAGRLGVLTEAEGLDADVRQLISRPLPHAVWRQLRPYQNAVFSEYIEARLREADERHGDAPFGLPHSQRRADASGTE